MTREELITISRESGLEYYGLGKDRERFIAHLQRFAALVAAAERELVLAAAIDGAEHAARKAVIDEREACAKVCDAYSKESSNPMNFANNCAETIRARGQA